MGRTPMIDPRVASGLRDLLPAVMIPRERILRTFRETFASFGFVPIETPHIERMEVLTGKGAGSDEVLRQIFEVTNKGGTPGELALRFDLTVPLARFVARHIDEVGVPFKRYAVGSVFRGERPAKGRFREFVQCDFDTIGTDSRLADAETALVIYTALTAAGVPPFTIALNDRKILDGALESLGLSGKTGLVLRSLDKLNKIGRDGVQAELSRPADSGGAGLSAEQAAGILDFAEGGRGGPDVLDAAEAKFGAIERAARGIADLRYVVRLLEAGGVPAGRIAVDLGLARGLDYYTGVVFETTVDGWERFGSVSSGGRYDDLASLFTARRLPGVGASIGLDRLIAVMEEAGALKAAESAAPVLIANFPGTDPAVPMKLASALRGAGIGCEIYPEPIQVGKQMGYGTKHGHKLAVIVGPDEVAAESFNLRDLETRHEDKGLAWSVLEDSVRGALEVIEHRGAGS
jgi:histidyl-tRNA synthetase